MLEIANEDWQIGSEAAMAVSKKSVSTILNSDFGFVCCLMLVIWCFVRPGDSLATEPLPVATVNVDRILRLYKPLNDKIDPLKAEAKELEANVQVKTAEIENVGNQLRQVQPGSAEHQKLQLQMVRMQTDLQRQIATSRNSLQTREATTYLAFFRQLDAEIGKLAKSRGIKLVLRQYESSLEDGQSLQDVAKALNRGILFEEGLDITDEVLKALDAGPGKPEN